MTDPVRILILDDEPTDIELIQRHLHDDGLGFAALSAVDKPRYLQALTTGSPDLVLADYQLPDFAGIEALELARLHCPVVPFIYVSGVLGEEHAIQTLKSGATDYVLKSNLARLAPAAQRALSEAADAVERHRLLVELHASEMRFRTLAEVAPIGILEVGPDTSVEYANEKMAEICGLRPASLVGRGWEAAVHPDDLAGLLGAIDEAAPVRRDVTRDLRLRRPDGQLRHVHISAASKGAAWGEGYVVTVVDVTDEVLTREALARQALYDSLTGLPNRTLFLNRLEQELGWRGRNGRDLAVLFLDLDHFKVVNDSLGHEAGDAVLQEVGRRMAMAVRAGETAARFSGDEFVFIVRGVQELEDATGAARRLLGALTPPMSIGGHELSVTGSMGIVFAPKDVGPAAVLRDADTAMYRAKVTGRGRAVVFDDGLHLRSVARLNIERELRHAIDHDEFEVYFQPIMDLGRGSPVGAEALVRWHHPARGIVTPLEFLPAAEESGLMVPIGRLVLEKTISQFLSWEAALGPELLRLSVNFSASQMDDPATPAMLREALSSCRIAPERLVIELTESAAVVDTQATRTSIGIIEELGIGLAIDDFGTGYSSLAHLHNLPVTVVKVDHSFVERLEWQGGSWPVVKAIVEMSRALGLRTVAEGVSSDSLRRRVVELGFDCAQGYLWSRPLPARDFERWWAAASAAARPGASARPGPAGAGAAE